MGLPPGEGEGGSVLSAVIRAEAHAPGPWWRATAPCRGRLGRRWFRRKGRGKGEGHRPESFDCVLRHFFYGCLTQVSFGRPSPSRWGRALCGLGPATQRRPSATPRWTRCLQSGSFWLKPSQGRTQPRGEGRSVANNQSPPPPGGGLDAPKAMVRFPRGWGWPRNGRTSPTRCRRKVFEIFEKLAKCISPFLAEWPKGPTPPPFPGCSLTPAPWVGHCPWQTAYIPITQLRVERCKSSGASLPPGIAGTRHPGCGLEDSETVCHGVSFGNGMERTGL